MQQLPLGIRLRSDAGFDNFITGANAALIASLRAVAQGEQFRGGLYLHGESGAGRSHLLHATVAAADRQGLRVALLPLAHPGLVPEILAGLESCDLVLLDDLQTVSNQRDWCLALFNLYNALSDAGHMLICAADQPPLQLDCALPDLRSRLSAGLVFSVHSLGDDDKRLLLMQHGEQRGLRVSTEVANFLLTRGPRAPGDLLALLDRLDHASLAEQRRLTVPFVKQVLGW